jgi:hypothetical protein
LVAVALYAFSLFLQLLLLLLLLMLLFLLLLYSCHHQADEELREGKLRFRGGRGEAATYDEGDEVRHSLGESCNLCA